MSDAWPREVRVAQLQQVLHGWDLVARDGAGFRLTDACRRVLDTWGGIGAVYGLFRTDPWTGRDLASGIPAEARADVAAMLQDAVRAASGGIGVLLVSDAPHGEMSHGSVQLPTNLAQAASWDPELVRAAADAVGRAARADGTHLLLCSGFDMLRDPRWGRSEETFGEAPLLAARMCDAQVRGFQGGDGLHPATHPGAVVKHLAAQGSAMGGRNAASAAIGEAELAEVHLPPVAAAIRAGAVGLMAAYNDIDGAPCITNRWLLTDLVRDRWGFDGIVMADALAIDRAAENLGRPRAAWAALGAGCDLNLGDESWELLREEGDEAGERAIVVASDRVRRLKRAFGLLPGQAEKLPAPPRECIVVDASRALARAAITELGPAAEPIPVDADVLVVGPFVDSVESMLGDYATPVAPGRFPSLWEALRDRLPRARTVAWDRDGVLTAAATADVVVVQLGGTSERRYGAEFAATGANVASAGLAATCGEGVDLADISLPHGQDEVLRGLTGVAARVIGVAVMGRPHVLTLAREVCDDVLVAWYPGPFGGEAIADVLLGDARPTGALPVTLLSAPGAVGWHDDDRVGDVDEGWSDAPRPALARLGDGAPAASRLLDHTVARTAGGLLVRLRVTADTDADDVVRVFGRRSGGRLWPRRRILLGFARARLAAGQTRELEIEINEADLFGQGDGATACTVTVEPYGVSTTTRTGGD